MTTIEQDRPLTEADLIAEQNYEMAWLQAHDDDLAFDAKKAKEAAEREERNRKEREALVARNKSRAFILVAIANECIKMGQTAVYSIDDWKLTVGGINASWWFHVENIREQITSWRSRETSRLKIVCGDYGNDRQSYPQRKDGSFAYDKIADRIVQRVVSEKLAAKQKRQMNRNSADVATLAAEFAPHLTDYSRPFSSSSRDDDHTVVINLKDLSNPVVSVTLDQAREILTTLRRLGFKLSYADKGDQS